MITPHLHNIAKKQSIYFDFFQKEKIGIDIVTSTISWHTLILHEFKKCNSKWIEKVSGMWGLTFIYSLRPSKIDKVVVGCDIGFNVDW